MVFLVRRMRTDPVLRSSKVVIVTDRKDLQRQLSETAGLIGESVLVGKSITEVKKHLKRKGPEVVFATIQKYVDREVDALTPDDKVEDLGVLNDDARILVMVDEAHRSHASALHARLLQALPNCARVGFTGTPIIMGAAKRTHEIFGGFIDRYTIKESEADGATVPILYEGRYAKGAVADGATLDAEIAVKFPEFTPDEREDLQRRYGTLAAILESKEVIRVKAADMLRHYVENILPNGLKAQVVAVSRACAVRYQEEFLEAREALVAEAEALDEATRSLDDTALDAKPPKLRAAVRAWRVIERLRALAFAAIISPENNDPPEWAEWSEASKIEQRIARFKKPFEHDDPAKRDPLGFLIVKSMLLTGFDAPIEGVMYLDRPIREAELLQAIARVNRTRDGKSAGIVVDYYGIAQNLKQALTAYSAEDIDGALQSLADEIPKLRDRHTRVAALFASRKVDVLRDPEAAVELLADEKLRAEFAVKLKQFLATLDLVLPRPEALPFVGAATALGEVQARAKPLPRRPRDARQVGRSQGAGAHRRAHRFARHRPAHSAHRDHRREVQRAGAASGVAAREGVGDGARRQAPHQEAPLRGPSSSFSRSRSASKRSSRSTATTGSSSCSFSNPSSKRPPRGARQSTASPVSTRSSTRRSSTCCARSGASRARCMGPT